MRALRAVAEAAAKMRKCDADIDAALNSFAGGADVKAVHEAAGWRCVAQHEIDAGLRALAALRPAGET